MITLDFCTTSFRSFEEREDVFRRLVDYRLARRYGGPALFWHDFRRISRLPASRTETRVLSVTSNPRDCLAFATAAQVLTAAQISAGGAGGDKQIADVAARFELGDLLPQPIRTLSGGESVKLALAKTCLSLKSGGRIVISSPFTWLSPANRHLLEYLVEQSRFKGTDVSILALDGEDSLSAAAEADFAFAPGSHPVSFSLLMSAVRIPLTLSINPLAPDVPQAAIEDNRVELESPCLLAGDNGQGKSLVARALAGSIAIHGRACIASEKAEGRASLLFQDVQTQTLLRSFEVLAAGGRGVERAAVVEIYEAIRKAYNASLNGGSEDGPPPMHESGAGDHPLLDIKAMLVAARLAGTPAALILDEPDWGLSRSSSLAFVSAVLTVAHRQRTPVLLISHKPWWQTIIRSSLSVSRSGAAVSVAADKPVFTIFLQSEAAEA